MLTLADIAGTLGATLLGDGALPVTGLSEPRAAGETDLALAMSPRFAPDLQAGAAKAAVVWEGADLKALGLEGAIVVTRPRLALSHLTRMMDAGPHPAGIHPSAVIDPSATLGANVAVGALSVIGAGAVIAEGAILMDHVSIAGGATIGANALIHAGARIGRNVTIGANALIHSNVVIGADGFSFVTATPSIAETGRKTLGKTPFEPISDATQHRIHSLGGVTLGDDVEVGANSTIDAGTIRATEIGSGTKIDNLVQVGHNVRVGKDCLLCAQTAIAGSSTIGDRAILGGKSGVADHVTVGQDCLLGGAAIVLGDIPDGSFVMGYPAKPMLQHRAEQRALRNAAKPR